MKFENRLEAMRWMAENAGRGVRFQRESTCCDYHVVILATSGRLNGHVSAWNEGDITNIRTADHKGPEPMMQWHKIVRATTDIHPLAENEVDSAMIEYHEQLMKLLESKFEAKK